MADVGGVMTVTEFSAEVLSEFYIVMDHGSADDGKTIRRGARLIYTVKSRYRFQLADNILKIAEAIPDNKIPLDAGSVQTFTPIVTYQLISADSGSIKLNLFDKDGMLIASSPEKKISRDDGKVDFPFDCTDNLCLKDIMLPDEDPLFLSAQMFDDTGVELLQSADIIYTFGGPDLTVSHIEVVQVTQTVDNKMPLVRNKQTLVRVYPGLADDSPAADPALKVTVALEGFAGAAPLPGSPRPPTAPWTRAKPVKRPGGAKPTMAERRRPNSSINFVLPTAWTQQPITLRAIVDPAGMVVGDKEKNNALDLPANFQRTNNLSVGYMRFSVPPAAGAAPLTPSNRVADAGAWVQRVYPVRDGGLAYFELTAAPIPWTPIMQGVASLADGRARLHRTLTRIYNLVERTLFLDQIVGYLDNSIQIYAAGNQGDSNPLWVGGAGRSAIAIEQFGPNNRGALLCHELGHNMGLRHTNVMGKLCFAMSDSPWMTKFTDNGIQDIGWELGAPGAPGPRIKRPAMSTGDMMGYCPAPWISPYHYEKLFDGGFAPGRLTEGRKVSLTPRLQSTPADYFLVDGSIAADGLSGRLDPVYRITSSTTGDQPAGGSTCIQLQNGGGTAAEHCFEPAFESAELGPPLQRSYFSFKLPAPAGVNRIALL